MSYFKQLAKSQRAGTALVAKKDHGTEFGKGLRSSFGGMKATGLAALGALTDNEGYLLDAQLAQQDNQRHAGDTQDFTDIDSAGSALDWFAFNAGNAAGSLATTALGGGLGGLAVKGAAKKAGGEALEKALAQGVVKEQAQQQALNKAARVSMAGTAAGMSAASYPQMLGENVLSIMDDRGGEAVLQAGDTGAAALTAVLQTSFDVMPVMKAFRKLGFDDVALEGVKRDIVDHALKSPTKLRQIGRDLGAGMLQEGTTEAIQEALKIGTLEYLNSSKDHFTVEQFKDVVNAFAAGAAGGVALGAAPAAMNAVKSDAPWFKQWEKDKEQLKEKAQAAADAGDMETYADTVDTIKRGNEEAAEHAGGELAGSVYEQALNDFRDSKKSSLPELTSRGDSNAAYIEALSGLNRSRKWKDSGLATGDINHSGELSEYSQLLRSPDKKERQAVTPKGGEHIGLLNFNGNIEPDLMVDMTSNKLLGRGEEFPGLTPVSRTDITGVDSLLGRDVGSPAKMIAIGDASEKPPMHDGFNSVERPAAEASSLNDYDQLAGDADAESEVTQTPIDDLMGSFVDYDGIKGVLVGRDDGLYVVHNGNDVLVERGLSGDTAEGLGVSKADEIDFESLYNVNKRGVATDWRSNTFTVRGKTYNYLRTESGGPDGITKAIIASDQNGKQVTFRDKHVAFEVEAQKIEYELGNSGYEQVERAIQSIKGFESNSEVSGETSGTRHPEGRDIASNAGGKAGDTESEVIPVKRDWIDEALRDERKANAQNQSESRNGEAELLLNEVIEGSTANSEVSHSDVFAATHELPTGEQVVKHPEEEGVWIDQHGDEWEGEASVLSVGKADNQSVPSRPSVDHTEPQIESPNLLEPEAADAGAKAQVTDSTGLSTARAEITEDAQQPITDKEAINKQEAKPLMEAVSQQFSSGKKAVVLNGADKQAVGKALAAAGTVLVDKPGKMFLRKSLPEAKRIVFTDIAALARLKNAPKKLKAYADAGVELVFVDQGGTADKGVFEVVC